jgi:hypothetical protein
MVGRFASRRSAIFRRVLWGFPGGFLSQKSSWEPGAASVTRRVGAATIGAFGRGITVLLTGPRLVALAALHTLRLCMTVTLRVVEALALVALAEGSLLVGSLDGDEQVTNCSQLENLPLVLRHLNEDQSQELLCAGGGHPGHLDRFQALVHQVGLNIVETDLDRDGSQNGSERFRLGESERVEGDVPFLEQEGQGPEIIGGTRIHQDTNHARFRGDAPGLHAAGNRRPL